ncbi:MAG TPA: GGDEF domain-containing protein [Polyangiaceae bacterium]|nr:GGDEF domain-containing protein [Polyangiaceae bacterium]
MTDARKPPGGRPPSFVDDFEEEITSVSKLPALDARPKATPAVRDRATFTIVSGPNAGAIHSLVSAENLIGRGKECSVRIIDAGISRRHARILRLAAGQYVAEDLGSSNGTFVGGVRIAGQHPLIEGDRLGVGPNIELRFGFTDEAEEGALRRLYESSVLDALTGAYNRKHFEERLASEVAYTKRHSTPLALLMFDLDHFKRVNDNFGHLGGDHVLRTVGGLVKRTLRVEDIFARYGGEEFAVIARGIDVDKGYLFAERVRITVETGKIEFNRLQVPVTISLGVASLACCGDGATAEALIGKADERLYVAKGTGRNRTVSGSRGR